MKPYTLMVGVGYHAVDLTARLGRGVLHLVLDRVYGPPQLAASGGTGLPFARSTRLRGAGRPAGNAPSPASHRADTPGSSSLPDLPTPAANVPFVAERICTAQLVGPHRIVFGVMWLYLYPRLGIARRVLKVTDPALARALHQDRFVFKEVAIDGEAGSRGMLDQLHTECLAVLNRRKSRQREQPPVTPRQGRKSRVVGNSGPAQLRLANAVPSGASAAMEAASTDLLEGVSGARPVAMPRRVRGDQYQGVVTTAGLTVRNDACGSPYRTYCLTVNDGAREVPLFGMELERQACDLRIRPGDRVRVVYMGREPLHLPGQSRPSYRNLYQLTKMESTS
jgi:hypothetical protein